MTAAWLCTAFDLLYRLRFASVLRLRFAMLPWPSVVLLA